MHFCFECISGQFTVDPNGTEWCIQIDLVFVSFDLLLTTILSTLESDMLLNFHSLKWLQNFPLFVYDTLCRITEVLLI